MKHSLIKYQFTNGTPEEWHAQVQRFIASLDSDPQVKGKIAYRVLKERDGMGYYHLASATDADAIKALQSTDFFKPYQEATRRVGVEVTVLPLDLIAETAFKA